MRGTLVAVAVLFALMLGSSRGAVAQTASQIAVAAGKACAVMSGERKADANSLQLLLLLDEDMSDPNPVAIALYRQVLAQCPKTYLAYEQRKRAANPFAGKLTKQTPTQLTTGSTALVARTSPDYAFRCHGSSGMAAVDGRNVTVSFLRGGSASALAPGHCAWLDRPVRPGEPARIVASFANVDVARKIANDVDAGRTWTFWVYSADGSLHATAAAPGTPARKP